MSATDPSALLDQRAALLDRGPSDELDRVTGELRRSLDGSAPAVRRITADEPGDLLDRLRAEEPVHPITSAEDLADRLDRDRRCYVLEYPELRGRPLNVVWVALWEGVAGSVPAVLDRSAPTRDPEAADTAVFYSIWSVERGLVGFPGGARLISAASDELRLELPKLRTFVTLSPIPGFREWLDRSDAGTEETASDDAVLSACASYLSTIGDDGRPLDRVARFHLGNGARLLALHRHGDPSERGQQRSFGIMANYRYEPEDRDRNLAELEAGRVALGEQVAELLVPDVGTHSR